MTRAFAPRRADPGRGGGTHGDQGPGRDRLETTLADNRHSPSLATLKKYAQAVGCTLEIHLVPAKSS